MREEKSSPNAAKILRWIARIWSILILVSIVMRIFTPDPYATEPVRLEDWFMLSFYVVAVLGIFISWRREKLGAIITIGTLFVREIAWIVIFGRWWVNFLIIWAVLVPPVILFLIAERLDAQSIG
jgi:hypothetical protein